MGPEIEKELTRIKQQLKCQMEMEMEMKMERGLEVGKGGKMEKGYTWSDDDGDTYESPSTV